MAIKQRAPRGPGFLRPASRIAAIAGVALYASASIAQPASNAEIILLVGKGEKRPTEQAAWSAATVNEKVSAGSFVRTLVNSQMGLYLPDRTQIRLNQNSQLQIKTVADSAQFTQTQLQLNSGRAWSQAKPQTAPAGGGNSADARVIIQTPTATMGVRGTDWEIEVGPNGETQLVVLSGVVDISNERGALSIGAGEAAVARAGAAPVRLVLVNPSSRVQWVSSWKPQPRRWAGGDAARHAQAIAQIEAGDYAAAMAQLQPASRTDASAALLLADVHIQQGDVAGAVEVLRPHATSNTNGRVAALMARAMARQDQLAQARAVIAQALVQSPASIELLLADGELAAIDGDAAASRRAYNAALAIEPRNAQAWYGIGLIESERENVGPARIALNEALRNDASLSQASAELAATEAFAGNLEASRQLLEALVAREPDNYVARTSLGVYQLKSGRPAQALDDFLKAGLVEPRYARAWLYTGVAHYQLGDTKRALEAFDKAAKLDPRDPVPYVYESNVLTDALDYGAAIEAARNAQARMPFLKSLNQVASDQKGSANLGASLANFGMQEWAGYYANQAASPYWGGSHLFLADRYTGKFTRNSELFQGFLTDPTAFGASSRKSSLVPAPGHYGRVDVMAETGDWRQANASATLNGLSTASVPMAYYFSGDAAGANATSNDSTARARNFTLGLGAKPRHDIGIFAFATDSTLNGKLRDATLTDDRLDQGEQRLDLGLNFKLTPTHQFWIKAGSGHQDSNVNGLIYSPSSAAALNAAFKTTIIPAAGTLDEFSAAIHQRDVQFRHAFDLGAAEWSWGAERSRLNRNGRLVTTFTPVIIDSAEQFALRQSDVWGSMRYRLSGGHELQADAFYQRARINRSDANALLATGVATPLASSATVGLQDTSEWNPRLGAKFQLAPLQSVRFAIQRWRRPASVGTLSPVDTSGIAVNDRLAAPSGLYRRARAQFDGEIGASTFAQAYIDRERVDNGLAGQRSPVSDFELTQLESLRDRPDVFSARSELEETPRFVEGKVASFGLAVNHLLGKSASVSLKYVNRDAKQTGTLAGLAVPFIPRHYAQAGVQWSLPGRWLVGASAIYRSERFRDDRNTVLLDSGVSFGGTLYWETADKRQSVQAIAENLLTRKSAGRSTEPHFVLRYSYNFDMR
ncbi:tetratricopeptide repeat protein [Caenimonas koreensis]|uniref:tetratricopeptide repeat protein n=1 Tax=Caenimonas koreensis TaxID=367474 RepID=UPI003783CC0F